VRLDGERTLSGKKLHQGSQPPRKKKQFGEEGVACSPSRVRGPYNNGTRKKFTGGEGSKSSPEISSRQ
jgi:hypothetical protein